MNSYQNLAYLENLYRLQSLGFDYVDPISPNKPRMQTAQLPNTYQSLCNTIIQCHLCDLSRSRSQGMVGFGSLHPKIVFVDAFVSQAEDETNSYYTGPARTMLRDMIEKVLELSIDDVYITHVVKCKPFGFQQPSLSECNSCSPYLHKQLEPLSPKIIVTLGDDAHRLLTHDDSDFESLRGAVIPYSNTHIIPIYHPAFLVRNPSAKKEAMRDLTLIKENYPKSSFRENSPYCSLFSHPSWAQPMKIALLSAPSVVGKYSSSTYNVALATLLSRNVAFELISIDMNDESLESISQALGKIQTEKIDAVLAPLTITGAKNLIKTAPTLPIFIPTVHKRDADTNSGNIIFGAIDYQAQIQALEPFMARLVATFYDNSPVGNNLNHETTAIASHANKSATPYSIDTEGSNIVKYLGKPSAFSKKSIVTHLPIVKTSMLIAHLTFVGAREHNILSTQMSFDPTLITLTQYKDRKNMIVANSIVQQVPQIYEINSLMNNDLTFDWINYTTSVGADYLISLVTQQERLYTLPLHDSQIIYPVELMSPREYGFEPFIKK